MSGSIMIAGLGPGSEDMITPEVRTAIDNATDIIGYIPYVARIAPRAGLSLHPSDNKEELDRAAHAFELACKGHKVVIVSSGDPGVFAMAGFSSSVTVTICVSVAVLPEASVTVHVTVVLPSEKFAGASLVTVYEQLSAAVALPKATPEAVQMPKSVETDTSAGAVMVGANKS